MADRPIDRLLEYLDFIEVSPYVFEKGISISNGYLNNQKIKKGNIGSEILDKIHNSYPELSLTWIISGEGEMIVHKNGNTPPGIAGNDTDSPQFSEIPPSPKGDKLHEKLHPTLHPTPGKGLKTGNYTYPQHTSQSLILNEESAPYGTLTDKERIARLEAVMLQLKAVLEAYKP